MDRVEILSFDMTHSPCLSKIGHRITSLSLGPAPSEQPTMCFLDIITKRIVLRAKCVDRMRPHSNRTCHIEHV